MNIKHRLSGPIVIYIVGPLLYIAYNITLQVSITPDSVKNVEFCVSSGPVDAVLTAGLKGASCTV